MSGAILGLLLVSATLLGSTLFPYGAFGRGSALFSLIVLAALGWGAYSLAVSAGLDERLAVAGGEPPREEPTLNPSEMPDGQRALLASVRKAREAYESSRNDLARGAARPVRAQDVCAVMSGRVATDWVGLVNALSARPDGRGVLGIDLGERTSVTTGTRAESGGAEATLIAPNSPLFRQAEALRVGAKVRFSGRFLPSDSDCLKEGGLTLAVSMQRPEYLMVFTGVAPWTEAPAQRNAVRAE